MPATDTPGFDQPDWLWELLGTGAPWSGERQIQGQSYTVRDGIPRSLAAVSAKQSQTEETFGFKWKKRDTFESVKSRVRMRGWLDERYGKAETHDFLQQGHPVIVDAGCGGALSALEYFSPVLDKVHYLGLEISEAVDVAAARFAESGRQGAFVQGDILNPPLADGSVDVIFSEGVLHHTDSTRGALLRLAKLLKPGGRFMFYVYRRKGPIREFTDDFVRERLQSMSPAEAWQTMEPLTELGIKLGQLNAEIELDRPIEMLGIPAGRHDVQRLFYWHVAKAFYHPDLTFDELNHINFDWYAPLNAHRQSPAELNDWCAEAGLRIEREVIEDAGITIIARKV